jgi:hypothetical protein
VRNGRRHERSDGRVPRPDKRDRVRGYRMSSDAVHSSWIHSPAAWAHGDGSCEHYRLDVPVVGLQAAEVGLDVERLQLAKRPRRCAGGVG